MANSNSFDDALQHELDEALGGMSLMDYLDEEESAARAAPPGVKRGQVLAIEGGDVLDIEAAQEAERTFDSLVEGKVVRGTVKTIMPYGAFVDIGGMDGLLHVRDMSYTRVEKPEDVVRPGQQLEVMIVKVDRE